MYRLPQAYLHVQERQDCPVAKDEARSFLQQSIPCSAKVVRRLQQAVQPVAEDIVNQDLQERKEATYKRAEFGMHSQPKADVQMGYINAALSHYAGTVPPPRLLMAELRERRRQQQQQQQQQPPSGPDPGGGGVGRAAEPHGAGHLGPPHTQGGAVYGMQQAVGSMGMTAPGGSATVPSTSAGVPGEAPAGRPAPGGHSDGIGGGQGQMPPGSLQQVWSWKQDDSLMSCLEDAHTPEVALAACSAVWLQMSAVPAVVCLNALLLLHPHAVGVPTSQCPSSKRACRAATGGATSLGSVMGSGQWWQERRVTGRCMARPCMRCTHPR
jgi:hypothetical protein